MSENKAGNPFHRARGGDAGALEDLLVRYRGRLAELAEKRLGTDLRARMHVSDVLQSVCFDITRDIERFRGQDENSFLAWASSILENKIRTKGRYFTAKRREAVVEALSSGMQPAPQAGHVATPSRDLARAEEFDRLTRALENLSEDYRDVLLLRGVEEKSAREIGLILGRSEPATRMLLSRARAALTIEMDRLRGSAHD